jgi:acyl-CoA reductase-like NAD-dependent aldehyde dehydrogenase
MPPTAARLLAVRRPRRDQRAPRRLYGKSTQEQRLSRWRLTDALAKDATLVAGGKANGAIMPATLLDEVTPDIQIRVGSASAREQRGQRSTLG